MQNLLRPFRGALRHNRIGRAGSPLPAGRFRVYGLRRVPHMRDAPYRLSAPLGRSARGHLGRSARKVGGAWQGPFSTGMVARRSRARNGADGRTPAEKPGQHDSPRRAVDCAPYLNSAPQRLSR